MCFNLKCFLGRSWVAAIVCAVAAIGVAGQRGGVDSNIRLGLLATDLGLPPVPGGQSGGKSCMITLLGY